MAQRFNTEEALNLILTSSSSEESDLDDYDPEKDSHEDTELEFNSDSLDDSSEGESTEEEPPGWMSKDGKICWSPTNDSTLHYKPRRTGLRPGPTDYAHARIKDPTTSFSVLLTDKILQEIVAMTNVHGGRVDANWIDLDMVELRAYVGLSILAGLYKSKHESTNNLWSEKSGRSIFTATMSQKRFRQISGSLRFDDKVSRPRRRDDQLAPIRKVWEMWTRRLPMLFSPDRDICIGEQLVQFRGRCGFKMYLPEKPSNYGLKIWTACDVETSYAWRLQMYTGKGPGAPAEVNQGMRVILEMSDGLQGHTITCDKFFTSFPLSEELLKRKMALVGRIKLSKPELPHRLLQKSGKAKHSSSFAFTQTQTLVSYIPRRGKIMVFLSTKHRTPEVSEEGKRKPVVIQDYNKCKRGVYNFVKALATYSVRRKTNRWPIALFHNMLDTSLYNAYVLWTSMEPDWQGQKAHRRRLFIQEVGEALIVQQIGRRKRLPQSSAAARIVEHLQAAAAGRSAGRKRRKMCKLCPEKKRKVQGTCSKCRESTCKEHSKSVCNQCFT